MINEYTKYFVNSIGNDYYLCYYKLEFFIDCVRNTYEIQNYLLSRRLLLIKL